MHTFVPPDCRQGLATEFFVGPDCRAGLATEFLSGRQELLLESCPAGRTYIS